MGVIGAIATGLALYGLRSILFMIFFAAFATVGLDPLIRWFQRHHFSRAWAIVTVILLIVGVAVAIVWVVLPLVVSQISYLVQAIPKEINTLRDQGWFDTANEASNGVLGNFVNWIAKEVKDPTVWAAIGSGVVGFGAGVLDAITSGFFVLILTIYFIASYDATKNAAYKLVSASHRPTFIEYSERILRNFGKYLSGMVILAFFNAVYSTILLLVTGCARRVPHRHRGVLHHAHPADRNGADDDRDDDHRADPLAGLGAHRADLHAHLHAGRGLHPHPEGDGQGGADPGLGRADLRARRARRCSGWPARSSPSRSRRASS